MSSMARRCHMKIVLMCDGLFVARIRLVKLNKALALRCEAQVFWLALCIPKASVRLDGQVLILLARVKHKLRLSKNLFCNANPLHSFYLTL